MYILSALLKGFVHEYSYTNKSGKTVTVKDHVRKGDKKVAEVKERRRRLIKDETQKKQKHEELDARISLLKKKIESVKKHKKGVEDHIQKHGKDATHGNMPAHEKLKHVNDEHKHLLNHLEMAYNDKMDLATNATEDLMWERKHKVDEKGRSTRKKKLKSSKNEGLKKKDFISQEGNPSEGMSLKKAQKFIQMLPAGSTGLSHQEVSGVKLPRRIDYQGKRLWINVQGDKIYYLEKGKQPPSQVSHTKPKEHKPLSHDEAELLRKDLKNSDVDKDPFRMTSFLKRIQAAEDGQKEAVTWAREWLSDINQEKKEKAGVLEKNSQKQKEESKKYWNNLHQGKHENEQYQAYLDTVEDPKKINSSVEYSIWASERAKEYRDQYKKLTGNNHPPVNRNSKEFRAYYDGQAQYMREYADKHLSQRVLSQKKANSAQLPGGMSFDQFKSKFKKVKVKEDSHNSYYSYMVGNKWMVEHGGNYSLGPKNQAKEIVGSYTSFMTPEFAYDSLVIQLSSEGAKEGAVKNIGGRTYQLINGRWHRVDKDQKKEKTKKSDQSTSPKEKVSPKEAPEHIHEDFGEKIGGARKDIAAVFTPEDIQEMTKSEISKLNKNKIWKPSEVKKLVEAGEVSPEHGYLMEIARGEIENATSLMRRGIGDHQKQSAEKYVEDLNQIRKLVLESKNIENLKNIRASEDYLNLLKRRAKGSMVSRAFIDDDFMEAKLKAAMGWPKTDIPVAMWPVHGGLKRTSAGKMERHNDWLIVTHPKGIRRSKGMINIIGDPFKTEEEAVQFAAIANKKWHEKKQEEKKSGVSKNYNIHKYLEEIPRKGDKHRNGNVTGKKFIDDFQIRGGEFGNWHNQKERQAVLNQSYDALKDMAQVLGMDDKAISLGGNLALAFGARGKGFLSGAAHFEPDRKVINMTRPNGAGSLGHEWGHALDNYLLSQAGSEYQESRFSHLSDITTKNSFRYAIEDVNKATTSTERVEAAMRNLMTVMHYKPTPRSSSSIVENWIKSSARSIDNVENYLDDFDRDMKNNLLKKHKGKVSSEDQEKIKQLKNEIRTLSGKKRHYGSAEEGEFNPDIHYSLQKPKGAKSISAFYPTPIAELSDLYKKYTGRKFHRIDYLTRGAVDPTSGTIEQLKDDIKNQSIRAEKTDFFKHAVDMAGVTRRSATYWTEPTEMLARAFESYLDDKMKKKGITNQYLIGNASNAGLRLFHSDKFKPQAYPEGKEKERINHHFDVLLNTIKNEFGNDFGGKTKDVSSFKDVDFEEVKKLNQQSVAQTLENLPQNGDTKEINGRTYQLINGRWHRVNRLPGTSNTPTSKKETSSKDKNSSTGDKIDHQKIDSDLKAVLADKRFKTDAFHNSVRKLAEKAKAGNAEHGKALSELAERASSSPMEKQKVPEEKIISADKHLDKHKDILSRLREGILKPSEAKYHFESLVKNEEEIKQELKKLTKDKLQRMQGGYVDRSMKKDKLIDGAYYNLKSHLAYVTGDSIIHRMGEDYNQVLRDRINAITDNHIKEYAKKVQEAKEQYEKDLAELKNPTTLPGFQRFIQRFGEKELSLEQQKKYDQLMAEDWAKVQSERESESATVKKVEMGDVGLNIVKDKHTKTGEDLFIAKMTDRVSREKFNELNGKAKQLGGYYSRFKGGFIFKNEDSAHKFSGLGESDQSNQEEKQQKKEYSKNKTANRLLELSERMIQKGKENLNQDRLTNTARRAGMAASAEASARNDINMGRIISEVAKGIEKGDIKSLSGIQYGADVKELEKQLNTIKIEKARRAVKDDPNLR